MPRATPPVTLVTGKIVVTYTRARTYEGKANFRHIRHKPGGHTRTPRGSVDLTSGFGPIFWTDSIQQILHSSYGPVASESHLLHSGVLEDLDICPSSL